MRPPCLLWQLLLSAQNISAHLWTTPHYGYPSSVHTNYIDVDVNCHQSVTFLSVVAVNHNRYPCLWLMRSVRAEPVAHIMFCIQKFYHSQGRYSSLAWEFIFHMDDMWILGLIIVHIPSAAFHMKKVTTPIISQLDLTWASAGVGYNLILGSFAS